MGANPARSAAPETVIRGPSDSPGMGLVTAAVTSTHLLFAAVWVGAVLFVTFGVLPLARDGTINAEPLDRLGGRLTTVSRLSALALLLTGGHMAASTYPDSALLETTNGNLVLVMVALWLVLAGLVEVGTSRLRAGASQKKVRTPASDATPFYYAASVVGLLLVVDAGLITTGALV